MEETEVGREEEQRILQINGEQNRLKSKER